MQRSFLTHAAVALVAGTGAALAALFLAGGPLSAQASQTRACRSNASPVASAPSTPSSTAGSTARPRSAGPLPGSSASHLRSTPGEATSGLRIKVTGTTGSPTITSPTAGGSTGPSGTSGMGPILSIRLPVAWSTGGTGGEQGSVTGLVAATAGQGWRSSALESRPLVTVRAPVNGTVTTGSSQSVAHAPASVVIGPSTSPDATGTVANLDAPVTVSEPTSPASPGQTSAGSIG